MNMASRFDLAMRGRRWGERDEDEKSEGKGCRKGGRWRGRERAGDLVSTWLKWQGYMGMGRAGSKAEKFRVRGGVKRAKKSHGFLLFREPSSQHGFGM